MNASNITFEIRAHYSKCFPSHAPSLQSSWHIFPTPAWHANKSSQESEVAFWSSYQREAQPIHDASIAGRSYSPAFRFALSFRAVHASRLSKSHVERRILIHLPFSYVFPFSIKHILHVLLPERSGVSVSSSFLESNLHSTSRTEATPTSPQIWYPTKSSIIFTQNFSYLVMAWENRISTGWSHPDVGVFSFNPLHFAYLSSLLHHEIYCSCWPFGLCWFCCWSFDVSRYVGQRVRFLFISQMCMHMLIVIRSVDDADTCARVPINNSPVTDVTSDAIRCNVNGAKGVAGICTAAGMLTLFFKLTLLFADPCISWGKHDSWDARTT